jgi:hypothetical protein
VRSDSGRFGAVAFEPPVESRTPVVWQATAQGGVRSALTEVRGPPIGAGRLMARWRSSCAGGGASAQWAAQGEGL